MNRNTKVILSLVAVLLIGFLAIRGCRSTPKTESAETEATDESAEQTQLGTPVLEATATPPENQVPVVTETVPEDRQAVAQKFAVEMKKLKDCFSMVPSGEDSMDPTLENLDSVARAEMGEVVARNEDWSASFIETPSGEKRMIRSEIDYSSEEASGRKLKYFIIGADGLLTAIPIPPEQASDPSEAFIASLETEGKVTTRERNTRAYYANGGEANYLEKDGALIDLELMYNGKTFQCRNLQSISGNCRCH